MNKKTESKPAKLLRILKRRPLTSIQIMAALNTTIPRDQIYRAKKLLNKGEDIVSITRHTKKGIPFVKYFYLIGKL